MTRTVVCAKIYLIKFVDNFKFTPRATVQSFYLPLRSLQRGEYRQVATLPSGPIA